MKKLTEMTENELQISVAANTRLITGYLKTIKNWADFYGVLFIIITSFVIGYIVTTV